MKRVLITCGPTREAIDPIRYLSNHSTGVMGFELAKVFKDKKYKVTLLHGPICPPELKGIRMISFESALDLKKLMHEHIANHDVLVMAAAVSDYRPVHVSHQKLKKSGKAPVLKLRKNPDLLRSVAKDKKNKIYVGFCVESEKVIQHAKQKLKSKKLDFIVAQKASLKKTPFGKTSPDAWILDDQGQTVLHSKISKARLAAYIEREVRKRMAIRG